MVTATLISATAAGTLCVSQASAATAPVAVTAEAKPASRIDDVTRPLQDRINDQLKLTPGARQISQNEVAFGDGEAVMAFPRQSEHAAPSSSPAALRLMAQKAGRTIPSVKSQKTAGIGALATTSSINGCPTPSFDANYYCFYQDISFGGRRLQWNQRHGCGAGSLPEISLTSFGFQNQTSSWVNGGNLKVYSEYSGQNSWHYIAWTEAAHTKSSWVGNTMNDRQDFASAC